jgi:hypothetical protein
MKMTRVASIVFLVQIGACAGFAGLSCAADTHVVTATSNLTWKSADGELDPGNPLVVSVSKGDILKVSVPNGSGPHGFVTIEKNKPALRFVWTCGQPESDETKNAVLREVECGAESKFNRIFIGEMKLEITDKFKDDVNFWCVQHTSLMPGIVKLKP